MKKTDYDLLDEERKKALTDGDYPAYAYLCDECGVDPEDFQAYERGQLDRRSRTPIRDLNPSESLEGRLRPEKKTSKKREFRLDLKPKYVALYKAAKGSQVNPDNIFADTYLKRVLLHNYMDYNKLISGSQERVSIDDAKEARVGEVFKQCFYRGKKLAN